MPINFGDLLISIAADASALNKGLKEADAKVGAFERGLTMAGRAAGALFAGAAVQQLAQFVQHSVQATAEIGRLADRAGLTAQQFQGLAHAFRDTQTPPEQLAQIFAVLGRNLSDLQRGTGPFLDFLQRSAPQLVEQFRAARDVNDAFGILSDSIATLSDRHDRLRLAQAAAGEMSGRLVNAMRQGRAAIDEQARAFHGMSDDAIRRAAELERRWSEMWGRIGAAGRAAIVTVFAPPDPITDTVANLDRLLAVTQRIAAARAARINPRTEDLGEYNRLLAVHIRMLGEAYDLQGRIVTLPPPQPFALTPDQIKAAQGQLALLQAQLSTLPQQTDFISSHFQAAWEQMARVMRANSETEAAISAQRIAMLRQEEAERQRVLGGAVQPMDELTRRQHELNYALERGVINAEQFGNAMQMAAATSRDAYLGAASAVAAATAKVFDDNKGVAAAAAVIATLEAANKALAAPPGPPVSYAYVAAALATGFANVRAILSTTKNSASAAAPSVSAPAAAPAAAASQSLHVTGVDRASFYSGAAMEGVIAGINEAVQNGATLISTRNLRA